LVEATSFKQPGNSNNGAVALRNVFSGMYIEAKSVVLDQSGARLDIPICHVQVVLDPYDDYGNIRSSCAFTCENNSLRNCEGIGLGIEEMNAAGD
jgi:hypothetical protein